MPTVFRSNVPVKRCFLDEFKVKDTAVFPMGFEGGTRLPRRKTRQQADNSGAAQSGARQPGICKVGDSSASASIDIEKTATVRSALFRRRNPSAALFTVRRRRPIFRVGQINTLTELINARLEACAGPVRAAKFHFEVGTNRPAQGSRRNRH